MFNEVFITDARVDHAALIGDINNGWAAADTTLFNERSGLGAGGGNAADGGAIQPGPMVGSCTAGVDLVSDRSASSGNRKGSPAPLQCPASHEEGRHS